MNVAQMRSYSCFKYALSRIYMANIANFIDKAIYFEKYLYSLPLCLLL
nr:MAG TPA: hypothetical protein [Caudoviricetes sp.]DAW48445.1 MAG TPA: hypothetical protein [Caudoviricetes sp.]